MALAQQTDLAVVHDPADAAIIAGYTTQLRGKPKSVVHWATRYGTFGRDNHITLDGPTPFCKGDSDLIRWDGWRENRTWEQIVFYAEPTRSENLASDVTCHHCTKAIKTLVKTVTESRRQQEILKGEDAITRACKRLAEFVAGDPELDKAFHCVAGLEGYRGDYFTQQLYRRIYRAEREALN